MRKLDETKLARLHTASELLEEEYGGHGISNRFPAADNQMAVWRDTSGSPATASDNPEELADQVGTARSYIARVEKGETGMQLSSFFRIARTLGIAFTPTFYD
ncbi:transcriptional regulator with XRE-family HTH domain [Bacteroides reticulotermitis]|uniref:HTH cro/C1-type domain-containing protein n=2 Tax=Bacteroides reticulotermitis TaxID=1133319 RepID=W4UX29_9BACE|nr:transcriptional regulator with XRE-family HTH domain [Bacteroides reticulotermitis]GAE85054.1 hypothetical protein JCM10512_3451 [Bacteroides reticulotermitis JCM 10512]